VEALRAIANWVVGLAVLSAIPAIVALIRMARAPDPALKRRRFWKTFLVGILIEIVIILIGFGICVAIVVSTCTGQGC
jgi:hypothetical protein